MKRETILIVDDEPSMRLALSESLESCGYEICTSEDGVDALKKFHDDRFSVVITDMRMPKMSGMEVLRGIKKISPRTPVIVITAYGTVNTAIEAMKEGASDFIMKPFSLEHLESVIKGAVAENGEKKDELGYETKKCSITEKSIITKDKKMLDLLELLRNVSKSKSTILMQGESGTGKELLARYIHKHSNRANMRFVAVNSAAIPYNLLESEMFGYEKGAFTGASQRKLGKFELANGGTLLLDEISEMSLNLQAKFLRVIQESEIDRLGGKDSVPLDIRIIATTNKDLKKCVAEKKFRDDLYYRLGVIPIKIPPLRERRTDITLLAEHFLENYSRLNKISKPTLSKEVADILESQEWPGNVRELENVIERAVLISGGKIILPEHLYLEGDYLENLNSRQPATTVSKAFTSQDITLKEMEKEFILETLEKTGGNKTKASKILGISLRTIRNKINEYENK
jgi:two-component system response regulator FlrC